MQRSDEGYEPQEGRRSGFRTLGQAARELPHPTQAAAFEKPKEHETQWASDFAAEYHSAQGERAVRISEDWKIMLPPGSKWEPGKLGRPDCAMCYGLGFVSVDLPLGHPKQGKVLYCECRRRADYPRLKTKKQLEDEAAAGADRA